MKIKISLSESSINSAIRKISKYLDDIDINVEELVIALAVDGADVAQQAYGNWGVEAVASNDDVNEHQATGYIDVIGDMPLIAEFGAGDAIMDPSSMFQLDPDTPVYPGSYSLLEGSRQYYDNGKWYFGGQMYTEVEPRMGLYQAKQYIINNSTRIAREVFGND